MPVMDGFEAIKYIRADENTAKKTVFALTAMAMKGDDKKILNSGFDGYFSKPVKTEIFTHTIAEIFGMSQ